MFYSKMINKMIVLVIISIIITLPTTVSANKKAITDTGREVILSSDGTWGYSDNVQKISKTINSSKKEFRTPKDSLFLLKSNINKSAYRINTSKWSFSKGKLNPDAEYEFSSRSKDIYGMVINEEISIPIEELAIVAIENAQMEYPNAKVIKQEYRIVNGKKVLYMEMTFIAYKVKFIYIGYYYSDNSGCTQLVTWTTPKLNIKYGSEINDFLNGLVTQ